MVIAGDDIWVCRRWYLNLQGSWLAILEFVSSLGGDGRSMILVFAIMSSTYRLAIFPYSVVMMLYLQENWSHGLTHSSVFLFNLTCTLLWILHYNHTQYWKRELECMGWEPHWGHHFSRVEFGIRRRLWVMTGFICSTWCSMALSALTFQLLSSPALGEQ